MRQRRIVAFAAVPAAAENRFLMVMCGLQNLPQRQRQVGPLCRDYAFIFNGQIARRYFRHFRCHLEQLLLGVFRGFLHRHARVEGDPAGKRAAVVRGRPSIGAGESHRFNRDT
jgi:hypothetical protein